MSAHLTRRLRCAVYTRKSTEEGLDPECISIDAQRDAGHADIASQRAEDWIPLAGDYDDPRLPGGAQGPERPGVPGRDPPPRPVVSGGARTFVERELWDAVQAILARNPRVRANDTRARVPFVLNGLVDGSDGHALTPWFTRQKNGRLYRYYLPVRENKEHAGASGLPRLPARELEAAVLEQLRRVLRLPAMIAGVTERAVRLDPVFDEAQVTVAMTRLDSIWEQFFSAEQQRIVRLRIENVVVSPRDLEVRFRPKGIEVLALELQLEPADEDVEEAVA